MILTIMRGSSNNRIGWSLRVAINLLVGQYLPKRGEGEDLGAELDQLSVCWEIVQALSDDEGLPW